MFGDRKDEQNVLPDSNALCYLVAVRYAGEEAVRSGHSQRFV